MLPAARTAPLSPARTHVSTCHSYPAVGRLAWQTFSFRMYSSKLKKHTFSEFHFLMRNFDLEFRETSENIIFQSPRTHRLAFETYVRNWFLLGKKRTCASVNVFHIDSMNSDVGRNTEN